MKKLIAILAVLMLTASTVFAAVGPVATSSAQFNVTVIKALYWVPTSQTVDIIEPIVAGTDTPLPPTYAILPVLNGSAGYQVTITPQPLYTGTFPAVTYTSFTTPLITMDGTWTCTLPAGTGNDFTGNLDAAGQATATFTPTVIHAAAGAPEGVQSFLVAVDGVYSF